MKATSKNIVFNQPLVLEYIMYCSNYKSAFFSLSSLAYIFHLHAFRTGPRAKQPRTVSLTNPPSSSSLPHHPPSLSSSTLSLSSLPNVTLETGMSVFVTGADFGVVRFIGTTQFAKGVWLGIELRKPSKYILLTHEASLSSRLNARIFLHIMWRAIHVPNVLHDSKYMRKIESHVSRASISP